MKLLTPLRFGLVLLAMVSGSVRLAAQPASEPVLVAVTNVKFDHNVRGINPGDSWYEVAIEVDAKPTKTKASNRHVGRVRATLNLGVEVKVGGPAYVQFYRASAEAIAIEQGKAFFRFYLPPEVVKRDNISGEAKYYTIDLEAEGKPQAPSRESMSSTFATPASTQGFQSKISSEAGANDGILQPQHLTPFAYASSKPAPTVIRTER